jgi:hypothetical protein
MYFKYRMYLFYSDLLLSVSVVIRVGASVSSLITELREVHVREIGSLTVRTALAHRGHHGREIHATGTTSTTHAAHHASQIGHATSAASAAHHGGEVRHAAGTTTHTAHHARKVHSLHSTHAAHTEVSARVLLLITGVVLVLVEVPVDLDIALELALLRGDLVPVARVSLDNAELNTTVLNSIRGLLNISLAGERKIKSIAALTSSALEYNAILSDLNLGRLDIVDNDGDPDLKEKETYENTWHEQIFNGVSKIQNHLDFVGYRIKNIYNLPLRRSRPT